VSMSTDALVADPRPGLRHLRQRLQALARRKGIAKQYQPRAGTTAAQALLRQTGSQVIAACSRASLRLSGLLIVGLLAWTLLPGLTVRPESATVAAPGAPPAERSPWSMVARPLEAFSLVLADAPRETRRYEARRHANGRGREDSLSLGSFDEPGAYMRVSLYRPGPEAGDSGTLFLDLARRAAEAGLSVERSAVSTTMTSKFGPIEVADVLLEGPQAGRACLAFRHLSVDPDFRISGWSCGSTGRPVDRVQLACQLDRLNLLSGADDKPLRALFLAAERNRDASCSPPRLSATGRKISWLDPESPAQLRHVQAAR
jgi:hypothetical protein